jgi:hypothetical protein
LDLVVHVLLVSQATIAMVKTKRRLQTVRKDFTAPIAPRQLRAYHQIIVPYDLSLKTSARPGFIAQM